VAADKLAATSVPASEVDVALHGACRLWVASWSGRGGLTSNDTTALGVRETLHSGWSQVEAESFGSLSIALWLRDANQSASLACCPGPIR
jgi:hypothetical protein